MPEERPDEGRKAGVEELMLPRQAVAFAGAKATVGNRIEVMTDRPAGRDEEDGYVARTQGQAPDIDSVTFVHANGAELFPGQVLDVKVTDFQAYDLVAEVPRKRSRSLAVGKA